MDDELSGIATTCDVSATVPNTAVLSFLFLLLSCSIYDLTNGSLPRVWIPNLYFSSQRIRFYAEEWVSTVCMYAGRIYAYGLHMYMYVPCAYMHCICM